MSTEHDDYREDEELDDEASRSIFAAGWFRAVLVLTVLAIAVVVALPYLLNWFEPAPAPKKAQARPTQTASAPVTPVPTPTAAPVAPALPTGPQAAPEPPSSRAPDKIRQTLVPVPGMPRAASAAPVKPSSTFPQMAKTTDTSRSERAAALPAKSELKSSSAGSHWVQLGLFKDPKNAETLARQLRDEGFSIQVARVTRGRGGDGNVPAGEYHVVRAGAFANLSAAIAARTSFAQKGHSAFLTESAVR
jgi:hypothetical protein